MSSMRYLWVLLALLPLAYADQLQRPFHLSESQENPALTGPNTASLRRFAVHSGQEVDHILNIAQIHDLDVWQVSQSSHVDIYSPTNATFPNALLQYSQSIVSIVAPNQAKLKAQALVGKSFGSTKNVAALYDWNLTSLANSTFHKTYHPLFEIDAFMYALADLYPDVVTIVQLGHSGEQREMIGLRISKPTVAPESEVMGRGKGKGKKKEKELSNKMGFVVTGAQHAREWVATASALYIAHALVSNVSEAHSLNALLDTYDFHIIPSPNPDGYDYTWETDRFWYKNRMKTHSHSKCVGLDMNRNWGYKWKRTPVSQLEGDEDEIATKEPIDPCSHWYPGSRPFQAPEVNNMANYISTLAYLEAFVDLRAYGQMLSSPYSYSCKRQAKDAEDQLEAALGATHALKLAHGTQFQAGDLCSLLYRAPGNIVDWMYARAGVKYSYAAHMRDTGTYGYALPPQWIRPVGEETANMVRYLAEFIKRKTHH